MLVKNNNFRSKMVSDLQVNNHNTYKSVNNLVKRKRVEDARRETKESRDTIKRVLVKMQELDRQFDDVKRQEKT